MNRSIFIAIISMSALLFACGGEQRQPSSPLQTLQTYAKALKKKDYTTMKLLLSSETMKMHKQQADAQGVTVDDIIKRETLISEGQTSVEFRNEKIDGDKATIELKDAYGQWQIIPFVREENEWRIDKKSYADQFLNDIEQQNNALDEQINRDRIQ